MSVFAHSKALAPRDRASVSEAVDATAATSVRGGAGDLADASALDPRLGEVRDQVLAYFARWADTIGLPRSVAAIYATLFLSESPLPFEEIAARSGLSKASASTGLRDLERLHGVERVVVPSDRRSFYRAQLSLRRILGAFLAEAVQPGLDDGARFLRGATDLLQGPSAPACPASDHLRVRLDSLHTWHERASGILPMLALLGAAGKDE